MQVFELAVIAVAIVACGKREPKASEPPSQTSAPAHALGNDAGVKALLAAGTSCDMHYGMRPQDCPELLALHTYVQDHRDSTDTADTCAAVLTDPDPKKSLLAAKCLNFLSISVRSTPKVFGAMLDAAEAERDPSVRERMIAFAISDADAMAAKLDVRVLALVRKLAAEPDSEMAASYLFQTLFPIDGANPSPAAQRFALASLRADNTAMQSAAFLLFDRFLDRIGDRLGDHPAMCAALWADVRSDDLMTPPRGSTYANNWFGAIKALLQVHDMCAVDADQLGKLVLARSAALDDYDLAQLLDLVDMKLVLAPQTRAEMARAVAAKRPTDATESFLHDYDAVIGRLSNPRPHD